MSALAPVMEGFFTERLIGQRRASPHTVASYRDTFRLLLGFAQRHTGKAPAKLDLEDLDAVVIGAFLDHLEAQRHNSVRTRNNRLAAIHSLFAYAVLCQPEHAALIQRVLAIPAKRTDRHLVSFLTDDEVDALLAAPDRDTWVGRRDHTLLLVAIQTACASPSSPPSPAATSNSASVRIFAVTAKAARNASPRSPPKGARSFASGWPNDADNQATSCSPVVEVDG